MRIFFADDAHQSKPTRQGVKPLWGVGGFSVPCDKIKDLENEIDEICYKKYNFPKGEEFKWSPRRGSWMHKNITDLKKRDFFIDVLAPLKSKDAIALILMEDNKCKVATEGAKSHQEDLTNLFIERVDKQLDRKGCDGIVIADRPGGARKDENKFLATCLRTLKEGTRYVKPQKIALNVLSTDSKLIRLLQVADVITSCSVARVAGEKIHSPPIFGKIKEILDKDNDRINGIGLKLHPDFRYANLYHWLIDDTYWRKGNTGIPLPCKELPYYQCPWSYSKG